MDPTLVLLVVALGAFIVFQTVQGRKRRRETEERQSRFVPGVEIMTNYGLYGTILSIDEDKNLATIETSPGTVLKIHRQTILKVADYDDAPVSEEVDADDAVAAAVADPDGLESRDVPPASSGRSAAVPLVDPQYGERTDEPGRSSRSNDKKADE